MFWGTSDLSFHATIGTDLNSYIRCIKTLMYDLHKNLCSTEEEPLPLTVFSDVMHALTDVHRFDTACWTDEEKNSIYVFQK